MLSDALLARASADTLLRLPRDPEAARTVIAILQIAAALREAAHGHGDPHGNEVNGAVSHTAKYPLIDAKNAIERVGLSRNRMSDDMARAAEALGRLGFWCRYAGFLDMGAALQDFALEVWPPGCMEEPRSWLSFRRSVTTLFGTGIAASGCRPDLMADALDAQAAYAGLSHLRPLSDYLRAGQRLKVGEFESASEIAARMVRRAHRTGSPRIVGWALALSMLVAGRRGHPLEAANAALKLVGLAGAPTVLRTSALTNLGVAFWDLGYFDVALECWEAALAHEAALAKRPWGLIQVEILGFIMALHAKRGDRPSFELAYRRLDSSLILPYGRVTFHRDAAEGLMRFGDRAGAMRELQRARDLAEQCGFNYDAEAVARRIAVAEQETQDLTRPKQSSRADRLATSAHQMCSRILGAA